MYTVRGTLLSSYREFFVLKAIAIIWGLFLILFVLIIIEESFLGGRRRRAGSPARGRSEALEMFGRDKADVVETAK